MNANKIIHEARDLCWHESKMELGELICDKCSVHVEYVATNPDYTDPVHYCALMGWMREKVGRHCRQRLLLFVQYMESKGVEAVRVWGQSEDVQVSLIAEWIESGGLK